MISLDMPIIVEGKYDKIKLSSLVSSTILTTNGFEIFVNKKNQQLFRNLAKKKGIIVFTDSDVAGFRIRNFINNIASLGTVLNAYIPDVIGKESRKTQPSKEGKLGVEGVDIKIVKQALLDAGAFNHTSNIPKDPITKQDFYLLGLTGAPNSSYVRQKLLAQLDLPEHLSTNNIISVLNNIMSKHEFVQLIENL